MKWIKRVMGWILGPIKTSLFLFRLGLLGLGLLGFTALLYFGRDFFNLLFLLRLVSLVRIFDLFYSSLVCTLYWVLQPAFRIEISGKENIPEEGSAILASRHRDVLDIPFMTFAAWQKRRVKFIARENMAWLDYLEPASGYFIPIDLGDISKSQVIAITKALRRGRFLGIFPQGTRYPDKKHPEGGPKCYGGFLRIAEKTQTPLVPLKIEVEGPYGEDWLKGLWGRFSRFKAKLKVGEPISVSELKARYCQKKDKKKLQKGEYAQVAAYFLEEIVDQV